jgi:uncharacterized protein
MSTLDSAQRAQVVDTSRSPFARLHTLPLDAVNLAGGFWEPRRRINREVTLPSQYRHLEDTGHLDNFRPAKRGKIVSTAPCVLSKGTSVPLPTG